MPVILATPEAEIRRIEIQAGLGINSRSYLKNKEALAEWLN
jgi:hypothetical protein